MNNKLICPFCQQELQETYDGKQFWCSNYKDHKHPINLQGTKELWQELIRTRKALDVAVDALKEYANRDNWGIGFAPWSEDGSKDTLYTEDGYKTAKQALEQITALEQKDNK